MTDRATDLARRFRDGEQEAFDDLMEALEERLYRVAYRITRQAADAMDVVQETFIKLYEHISDWDERAAIGSWTYRIATNAAIDRVRRQRRDRDAHTHLSRVQQLVAADPTPGIADADEQAHQLARVHEAVAQLPEGQQVTIILRHYEGLSLKEIAEVRECAVGTVKSTLFQAVARLRELLDPAGCVEPGEGR